MLEKAHEAQCAGVQAYCTNESETELLFAYEVKRSRLWPWSKNLIPHKTAIFRQVNVDCLHAHHDALEFPDGDILLLTYLMEGQEAVVLQLPAAGSKAPQRAAYV